MRQPALPAAPAALTLEPATAPAAARRRIGGLDPDLAAIDFLAVELRYGLLGILRRGHLDESEAPGLSGAPIRHHAAALDAAHGGEHLTQALTRCGKGETSNEQLVRHDTPPNFLPRRVDAVWDAEDGTSDAA